MKIKIIANHCCWLRLLILLLVVVVLNVTSGPVFSDDSLEPLQSTTGPKPPAGVLPALATKAQGTILGVPSYHWRHGCGPTAVGMVIGYWDMQAYPGLILGDSSTQTDAVNQAIASRGVTSNEHYEDYALPIDHSPNMLTDAHITAGRTPHADNCIADWMDTSRSTHGNFYGWSWSSDICPAYNSYVNSRGSTYIPTSHEFSWSGFSWDDLQTEIDEGRPLVFLVDSKGDGDTDHFVTIVGYSDDKGYQEYGCRDTWSDVVRWERFRAMSSSYTWGVSRIYTFVVDRDDVWWVDFYYSDTEDGTFKRPYNTLAEAVGAADPGDTIYVKNGSSNETILIEKQLYIYAFQGSFSIGN